MTTGYIPYRSASLLGPINEIHHLFAVLNDPCDQNLCLLVNVTSIKENRYYDTACVLDVGDHSFIKHPSYLLYRLSDTMRADKISRYVGLNYYLAKEDWSPEVFQRIVGGIRGSDDVPTRIVRYADVNGIV